MKTILILLLNIITLFSMQLTRSGTYVIDDIQKVMWQDTKDNVNIALIHDDAIKYCQELNLSGFDDWYLPSTEHYKYAVDKTKKSKIKLSKAFRYKLADNYWTQDRTWLRNFGLYGYYINLVDGNAYYQNRTYRMFVRCIRDMK